MQFGGCAARKILGSFARGASCFRALSTLNFMFIGYFEDKKTSNRMFILERAERNYVCVEFVFWLLDIFFEINILGSYGTTNVFMCLLVLYERIYENISFLLKFRDAFHFLNDFCKFCWKLFRILCVYCGILPI